jgi:hypothetical protein
MLPLIVAVCWAMAVAEPVFTPGGVAAAAVAVEQANAQATAASPTEGRVGMRTFSSSR